MFRLTSSWATLRAVSRMSTSEPRFEPFSAAVALYPWCEPLARLTAPLLVLVGEQDDWTPAARCRRHLPNASTAHEVTLKVYPEAYHLFDHPGTNRRYAGHVMRYDATAAQDAIEQVRAFLAKHFR